MRTALLPTTTAAAAATAAPEATTTAAAAAALTFTGFVDVESTAVEFGAVHLRHGSVGCTVICESDESESTAPSCVTVSDDFCVNDFTVLFECGSESFIVRSPAQSTHKKLFRHLSSLFR